MASETPAGWREQEVIELRRMVRELIESLAEAQDALIQAQATMSVLDETEPLVGVTMEEAVTDGVVEDYTELGWRFTAEEE